MHNLYITVAIAFASLLLLAPSFGFVVFGWGERRADIERGFSNRAIEAYFKAFHQKTFPAGTNMREEFKRFYFREYGRLRYVFPLFLFTGIGGLFVWWAILSLEKSLVVGTVMDDNLPLLAVFALAGAFMWIVNESIRCWYASRLSPADLYGWTLRLVIAIPTAYALKSLVTEAIAPAIAFFIGAFPTTQLFTFFRRISSQKLGLTDGENKLISELQKLQGIDTRAAERFADEGITTVMQLAYADPIQITIRTGYSYSLINDWMCQAILWLYFGDQQPALTQWGLRSAYEMRNLWLEFADPITKAEVEARIDALSQAISLPKPAFLNVMEQVAQDPYTEFLFLSWSDT